MAFHARSCSPQVQVVPISVGNFLLYLIGEQPGPVRGCETLVVGTLRALNEDLVNVPDEARARAQLYPVHQRCMSLLSTRRTRRDLERLISQLSVCNCAAEGLLTSLGTHLHDWGLQPVEPRQTERVVPGPRAPGRKLFDALVLFLGVKYFRKLYQVERNTQTNFQQAGGLVFPASPSDLFPDGDIHGMQSVLDWMIVVQTGGYGMTLMGPLLASCPGYGVATFVTFGAQYYEQCLHEFSARYLILDNTSCPGTSIIKVRALDSSEVVNELLAILKGINEVHTRLLEAATDAEITAFAQSGGGIRLVIRCSQAHAVFSMLPVTDNRFIPRKTFQKYFEPYSFIWRISGGRLAYLTGCSTAPPTLNVDSDFIKTVDIEIGVRRDEYCGAWRAYTWLETRHRCGAPDCHMSEPAVAQSFRQCNRCKVVKYCSTICQKAAWKHASLPHKLVCKQLQKVDETLLKRNRWSPEHGPNEVPPHLRTLHLNDVVGLGAHLEALHRSQHATHRIRIEASMR